MGSSIARFLFPALTLLIPPTWVLAQPGLFAPSSPQLPAFLKARCRSVYQVVLMGSPGKQVDQKDYSETLKKWSAGDFLHRLSAPLLRQCALDSAATCLIPYTSTGTAFLADSNDTLWSARHIFEGEVNRAEVRFASPDDDGAYARILKIPLSFVLLDSGNHVVFDTRNPGDSAQLTLYGIPGRRGFDELASDISRVHLSRRLPGELLTFSSRVPLVGEKVFLAGYPTTTQGTRAKFGAPDADGLGIRVSVGNVLDPLLARKKMELSADRAIPGKSADSLLFSDADGVAGQSGSPVFDRWDRVVSIYSKHSAVKDGGRPEEGYSDRGGGGISTQALELLLQRYR